jgi:hypothetical protein
VAKAIKHACESAPGNELIPVGSWGCGYGSAEALMVLAGANLKAFDKNRAVAQEANKFLWSITRLAGIGDKSNLPYSISCADVELPKEVFMKRKNQLNICFNVMHYLTPKQNKSLLSNLFENTVENGFVVITAMSIDEHLPEESRINLGDEYPFYKIYRYLMVYDAVNGKCLLSQISDFEDIVEDEEYLMCRPESTIIEPSKIPAGISKFLSQKFPHTEFMCSFMKRAINYFTVDTLKRLLENQGFVFIKGFKIYGMITVIAKKPFSEQN